MYKIFKSLIMFIWVFDVFNFKGFEFLDTTLPINFWAWLLIFIILPATSNFNYNKKNIKKQGGLMTAFFILKKSRSFL